MAGNGSWFVGKPSVMETFKAELGASQNFVNMINRIPEF